MGCLKLTYRENLTPLKVVHGVFETSGKAGAGVYRCGFNGQEKDDEIAGSGNSYTAEYWQYDSRLGRRWNQDPKPNPSISNYATFANNPILFSDPLGDTIVISIITTARGKNEIIRLASSEMIENQVNDGVFIVVSHGSPQVIQNDLNDSEIPRYISDPNQIFELLNTNTEWKEAKESGMEITLILAGCNTATEPEDYYWDEKMIKFDKPLVQRVSEADKDITVIGPDGFTQYNIIREKRSGMIGKKGKAGIVGIRAEDGNDGGWVTYKAGQKKSKVIVGAIRSEPKNNGKKIKFKEEEN
jgi:RHS repeat-associated protein